MYGNSTAELRCAVGVTEGFEVKVGSALSHCFFAMVMTDEIRGEVPWTMMFAHIVICSESKEQVDETLESRI